jgi:DNA-binding GntR family transcriptional regulator
MLLDVISGLWLKAGPIINLDMRSSPYRLRTGRTAGLHADAVAAIRLHDGAGARAAIAEDIQTASDFIIARCLLPE